jgi:hypothetical protein
MTGASSRGASTRTARSGGELDGVRMLSPTTVAGMGFGLDDQR